MDVVAELVDIVLIDKTIVPSKLEVGVITKFSVVVALGPKAPVAVTLAID